MSYPENISPNVTIIDNDYVNDLFYNVSTQNVIRCHGNDIFEISPVRPNTFNGTVKNLENAFKSYRMNGGMYPVSTSGLKDTSAGVGSDRFCTMSSSFAERLTDIIKNKSIVDYYTEAETKNEYSFLGVSKYFRFMSYRQGGEHFPHYDSDFEYVRRGKVDAVTKFSLVVYFSDCESGEFAFVNDKRVDHNNSDWDRQANPIEIYLTIKPSIGKILLFPHDLCHTVLPFTDKNNTRMIVRGDILFTPTYTP